MQVRPVAPVAIGKPLGQGFNHLVELVSGKLPVGIGPAAKVEKPVLVPLLGGAGGHHLLAQDVQGPGGNFERVQVAPADGPAQGGAFHQFVAGQGKERPLGNAAYLVARAPDPLQQQPDGTGRTNLAHQVHVADVDAQFQGSGGDADLDIAMLEPLLGGQPRGAGQTAVVGRHRVFPHPFRKLVGYPLHQPPRVDEHQRGVVTGRQSRDGVQRLPPDFVGGDRPQLVGGKADGKFDFPGAARVHNQAVRGAGGGNAAVAHQEAGHLVDRALGGRQADAGYGAVGQGAQPLHRQGKVGSPLVVGHGVDFVQDDGLDLPEAPASAFGSQQDVKGLRGSNQDVGAAVSPFSAVPTPECRRCERRS